MKVRSPLKKTAVIIGFISLAPGAYFASVQVASYFKDASYERPAVVATTTPEIKRVAHVSLPEPVKAVYMTACVAATPSWRKQFIALANETEINSIVIDIKDYTGTISFVPEHPLLKENKGTGCRAKDMPEFVEELHKHGIYVIGRITVFQDPYYTKARPDLAVKSASTGGTWKDYKGLSFIDVGAKEYWDYIVALSEESYRIGFDELNYDYIRFPSDGNMKDVHYSFGTTTKALALRSFFEYLNMKVKPTGAVLSADLFGMVTTNYDDLNIGQVLEHALPYFDFISPMVYPSHYPSGFNGWKNPNLHVYEVVNFSMSRAAARAEATSTPLRLPGSKLIASSTPACAAEPCAAGRPERYTKPFYDRKKLRPWLQDFSYGGTYGAAEVRAQIQATYDAGLTSWMLWDPANSYTREALLPAPPASAQ